MTDKFFHLLKTQFGVIPHVEDSITLSVLMEACTYYKKQNGAILHLSGRKIDSDVLDSNNAIYIADISEKNPGYFSLLLIRGDPNRPFPGVVNTHVQRVSKLISNDADAVPGSSCHIIFSKAEVIENGRARYKVVIEQSVGISRALIKGYFAELLTKYSTEFPEKFSSTRKKKTRKAKIEEVNYRPTIRLHPQKNANLETDLENGMIGGFKLTQGSPKFRGEAGAPSVVDHDIQFRIKIKPTNKVGAVRGIVRKVMGQFPGIVFDYIKVELEDAEGRDIASPRSMKMGTFDDEDMRYCKKLRMPGLTQPLPECCASLEGEVLTAARQIISKQSNWK